MTARPKEPLRFTGLTLLALIVAAGGGYLVFLTFTELRESPCNANDSYSGWRIVLLAGGAFIAGHLFSRRHYDVTELDKMPAHPRRVTLVTHGALAVFLACVAIILVYETVSLWNPPGQDSSPNPWGLHPITHYVRCAKSVSPIRTTIITMVVGFFVGHWLWPPQSRERPAHLERADDEEHDSHAGGEK